MKYQMLYLFRASILIYFFLTSQTFPFTNVDFKYINNVERTECLKEVFEKITSNGFVFITGSPGVGKSHLVNSYIIKYIYNLYDIVWVVDCSKNISTQLIYLVKSINQKEDKLLIDEFGDNYFATLDKVALYLREKKLNMLLVFDNFSNNKELSNILKYVRNESFKIIFTTRTEPIVGSSVKVGLFNESQSLEYLQKRLPFYSPNDLNRLAKTLNGYPICLNQASSYLVKNRSISIDEYVNLYENDIEKLWSMEEKFLEIELEDFKSVRKILKISLSNIRSNKEVFVSILNMFSVMHNQNIPTNILLEVARKSHWDEEDVKSCLSELVADSYIDVFATYNSKKPSYFIHDIKQQAIRIDSNRVKLIDVSKNISEVLLEYLSKNKNRIIDYYYEEPNIFEHVISFLNNTADIINSSDINIISLKIFILDYFLYVKRDHFKAMDLINDINKNIECVKNINTKARFFSSAGDVFFLHKVDTQESRDALKQMIDFLNKNENMLDDYEIVRLSNSITQAYLLMGMAKNSKSYIEKSLEIVKKFSISSSIIPTYYFASWYYNESTDYDSSVNILNKAILLFEDSPTTAIKFYVYNNKALSLLNLRKYSEALDCSDISIKGCKDYFGPMTSDTLAEALAFKAQSLLNLDDHERAFETIELSIGNYYKFYNSQYKTVDQSYAWYIKGNIFLKLGNALDAHSCFIKAQNICDMLDTDKSSKIYKNILKKLLYTSALLKKKNIFNSIKYVYKQHFTDRVLPFELYTIDFSE